MTTCPTCSAVVPPTRFGRPRTYCRTACRREMARLRRELVDLEAQAVEHRQLAANDFWPGSRRWTEDAEAAERAAEALRRRIMGAMK